MAAPTLEELQALLAKIITRIMRWLTKQGFLIEEQDRTYLAEADSAFAPASGLLHLPHRARATSGAEGAEPAKRGEPRQIIHAGPMHQTPRL